MTSRFSVSFVAFMVLGLCQQDAHAQAKPDFSDYDYSVTEDGAFGLYKPKEWKVGTEKYPNGKMVFVTDERELSLVSMTFLEMVNPSLDSVTLAGATIRNVIKQMPDLKILEARSSRDRMHTVVKYQRTGGHNTLIEGRSCFNVKRPTGLVTGYEAPAAQFKQTVSTLLTVAANIIPLDAQAYQKAISETKDTKMMPLPMREASAPDGTCRLAVPQGWNLTAGKGAALCTSSDGDVGYLFTTISFVGQSRIPNFDSRSIPGDLRYNYMLPVDALVVAGRHSGSRDHRILERYSNPSWAKEASFSLRRGVDAEVALIACTSKTGTAVIGYYDVLGLHPDNAGQWAIIPMGFWAPTSQFAKYLPTLLKIAESYRINEQWAADYVRRGQEKVREMMKKTSSMMSRYAEEMRQSSLAGHQNRMKSSDFTSYKFSTYMRGEQEWVTSLEGGTVVTTDHWGLSMGGKTIIEGPPFNYYNFQGEKYGLIPVDISREVYEAVKGVP